MARQILKTADDMATVARCWRMGLRAIAAKKFAQLMGFSIHVIIRESRNPLLPGYLQFLWTLKTENNND